MNRNTILSLTGVVLLVAASCLSVETGRRESAAPKFYGMGLGEGSLQAVNAAKGAAVRSAAEKLLGPTVSSVKREELDRFFSDIGNHNLYVFPETMSVLSVGEDENGHFCSLLIKINLPALGSALAGNLILGGQVTGMSNADYFLADSLPPSIGGGAPPPPAKEPLSDQEEEFVDDRASSLVYMVYHEGEEEVTPFHVSTAITSANGFLQRNGINYVDLERIESLKRERKLVYEEVSGTASSVIQWIAHRLNADIYIRLSLSVDSRTEGERHLAGATVTLNAYDTSTADGIGTTVYQTIPPAFSNVSIESAESNAVAAGTTKGMEHLLDQIDTKLETFLTKGFMYAITILNAGEGRVVNEFEKSLQHRVRSIRKISYSREQVVFEVYFAGEVSELEELVYYVSDSLPEFAGISLVLQQKRALIFELGY